MELVGKRAKAAKNLKGGLVLSIIFHILYTLSSVIYMIILLFIGIFGAIIQTIIGAISGSSGDVTSPDIPEGYTIGFVVVSALVILSFVSIILAAVALGLINKSKKKGGVIAAGILGIIGSIPTIIIPLELIGGIVALTSKEGPVEIDPPSASGYYGQDFDGKPKQYF